MPDTEIGEVRDSTHHELEEIEEQIEDILETLDRLEKQIATLLPPPPGKAVSAVLYFKS